MFLVPAPYYRFGWPNVSGRVQRRVLTISGTRWLQSIINNGKPSPSKRSSPSPAAGSSIFGGKLRLQITLPKSLRIVHLLLNCAHVVQWQVRQMIYHCIRYTIDPHKFGDFETYARRWTEGGIIERCGGKALGYFLPKKGLGGADNIAMTLIGFENLAAYERYRSKLVEDPEAKENLAHAEETRCILVEERSYFYRVGGE